MFQSAPFIALFLALWIWWPVRTWSRPKRLLAMLLTWLAGVLPVALIFIYRDGAISEDLVVPAQVFSAWALATLLLALPLVLLRDLWRIAAHLRRRTTHTQGITLTALGISAVLALAGVYGGLRAPELHEQEVRIPNLPPELDGLRVAVLADLHVSPVMNAKRVQTVVNLTNAARPDLVLLPGDLADGDPLQGARHIEPLRQLKAPLGVWAAPGNHEYYSGYDGWARAYRNVGLNYLENQSRVLDVRGKKLAISGVGDPAYGRLSSHNADPLRPEGVPPDIDAVLQQAAGSDAHLLMAHQPKLTQEVLAKSSAGTPGTKGVDLQLSGHTHGGHILGLDRWVVAPANHGFVRGHHALAGMQLYVSSGAGQWAGFAIRLGVPKQVPVLTLRASAS